MTTHTLTEGCEITARDSDGGMWAVTREGHTVALQYRPADDWVMDTIIIPDEMLDWVRRTLGRV